MGPVDFCNLWSSTGPCGDRVAEEAPGSGCLGLSARQAIRVQDSEDEVLVKLQISEGPQKSSEL